MPHWDEHGREEWVCQKGGHICTGESTWVERNSPLSLELKCHGNVCEDCLDRHERTKVLNEDLKRYPDHDHSMDH